MTKTKPNESLRNMQRLLKVRSDIYNQFQGSISCKNHFHKPVNEDAYAAYYTSMYLIQDTGEAVEDHMSRGFSAQPYQAYLEFWGVMQAIVIQQDAIFQIHEAVVGNILAKRASQSSWAKIRDTRHLCAGHPAKRSRGYGVTAPQRTFMGRSFGGYNQIQYEKWDAQTSKSTYPVFNLRQMIDDYDKEATVVLNTVLSTMKKQWP